MGGRPPKIQATSSDGADPRTAYMQSLINKMQGMPEFEKNLIENLPADISLYSMANQDEFNKQVYQYGIKDKLDGMNCLKLTIAIYSNHKWCWDAI